MATSEGVVGPSVYGDGTDAPFRIAKDGSVIVGQGLGRFEEMARRGIMLTATTALAGVSIAATHVSPLPANTGTPLCGIGNPVGSGYDIIVCRAKVWSISGTPGGPWGWNTIAAPHGITATGAQGRRNDTFVPDGPPCVYQGTTVVTGSAVGVMFRGLGGPAAIAAGAGQYGVEEDVTDIIIPPGAFAGIVTAATGTSHVAGASITYALRKTGAA